MARSFIPDLFPCQILKYAIPLFFIEDFSNLLCAIFDSLSSNALSFYALSSFNINSASLTSSALASFLSLIA